ncbi:MAG: hydroxymethylbilane synthase [Actinobacteria bacterium]|nr:hydroxymethylbilane synthase [Actinomycetota bacterium]MCB8998131.1 hydroxymethylbilane synthase [Actinomycetota bacterium]MCB9415428.1 hydroxymethylbilane synthase [Actinomycetota bacterium]HRY09634.1 hydroxymethylbilane synthase [Candidatus Nanopelagicales bacterium]
MPDFTVATRASALARAQTGWVRDRLADLLGIEVAELLVTSEGDVSDAALTSFGGQGVFVARVREAVLDGRADVAVHSMKDLPTLPHPGTAIAAVPTREDVRDFLVTTRGGLDDLPSGASVGTGSPRRVAYLRRRRPDLRVVAIRGNVDTRVARVKDGDLDAVVVATAGLIRLGLTPPGAPLAVDDMLPAVGQGALAVEMRADDARMPRVRGLDDAGTRAEVIAERALLAGLRAGCSAPVGATATATDDRLDLRAAVLSLDGSQMYECTTNGPLSDAEGVGRRAADLLIGQGADQLLGEM